ncbi:MAG: sodium/glutamate symporter [Pseudomonadota bacterium]
MLNQVHVDDFMAITVAIAVYFLGKRVNDGVSFLRHYNIPDSVTGGLLASLAALGVYWIANVEISYDLETRDRMLVYFFTTIGLNARISDLIKGGKPLVILLALTLGYIVIQNLVGIGGARALGLPDAVGLLTGSASLIGGHGTAIAWAPEIAANHGVPNALEIGVASATLGLVMASLSGGPIAQFLLQRFKITGPSVDEGHLVGVSAEKEETSVINYESFLRTFLIIHLVVIVGYGLNLAIAASGLNLPFFVSCLMVGILTSNLQPILFPKLRWPARSKSLAFVSELSLAIFISMSLMSMQLWTIAELAGPLLILLASQLIAAVFFILFFVFPLMGRDYLATVLSAGFAGFSLGATPTAIANMTAVTKSHGPAPTAFIILPLVGAFFVDIANAVVIQAFLSL